MAEMYRITLMFVLISSLSAQAQPKKPQTLREVLLEQLHTTHDQENEFVPISVAVADLTPEQASWTDGHGDHSIGQIVNHLAYWNTRWLERFKGEQSSAYNGNNDETFDAFNGKAWRAIVSQLDTAMKGWEKAVESADESKLKTSASQVANVSTHNAYHLGQILYIRKMQGVWNPAKGVK